MTGGDAVLTARANALQGLCCGKVLLVWRHVVQLGVLHASNLWRAPLLSAYADLHVGQRPSGALHWPGRLWRHWHRPDSGTTAAALGTLQKALCLAASWAGLAVGPAVGLSPERARAVPQRARTSLSCLPPAAIGAGSSCSWRQPHCPGKQIVTMLTSKLRASVSPPPLPS